MWYCTKLFELRCAELTSRASEIFTIVRVRPTRVPARLRHSAAVRFAIKLRFSVEQYGENTDQSRVIV
jgi:hypothetical protein